MRTWRDEEEDIPPRQFQPGVQTYDRFLFVIFTNYSLQLGYDVTRRRHLVLYIYGLAVYSKVPLV